MLGHTHMVTPATTHEHRTRTPTVAHVRLLRDREVGLLVGIHFRHIPFLVASRAHDEGRLRVSSGYIRFDRPHISALALAGAEKILAAEIDADKHADLLKSLAAEP